MTKQESCDGQRIVQRVDSEDPLLVVEKDPKHPNGEPSKQAQTILRGYNIHRDAVYHQPIQGARNSK